MVFQLIEPCQEIGKELQLKSSIFLRFIKKKSEHRLNLLRDFLSALSLLMGWYKSLIR